MANKLLLEVSTGEAIDKLSILDIKCKKIRDEESLNECAKEYNLLYKSLQDIIIKYKFLYEKLIETNLKIWNMQDQIRVENDKSQSTIDLCLQIIYENDKRFRIKKKINLLSESELKEQKGYTKKTAFVLSHLGLGDMICMIGAVRYLSLSYDNVIVVCKNRYLKNVKLFYKDDDAISFFPVENDSEISPCFGFPNQKFIEITKKYDVYKCGLHDNRKIYNIPNSFYMNFNIDTLVRKNYFSIPSCEESKMLFDKVKNIKYIFIHQQSSTCKKDILSLIENKEDFLIIDPNSNIYDKTHKYFNLCNEFLNIPLIHYVDTIKNANQIYMVDSSFFCLAMHLDLSKVEKKFVTSDYSHLDIDFNFIK